MHGKSLTIVINFICSKDTEEERVIDSNRDNINFIPYSDADDVINKLFMSLHSRYQENLETSMEESDFIFDSVRIKYYKSYKVSFIRSRSYINSPDLIKREKATISLKNTKDKMFLINNNCNIKLGRN